MNRLTKLLTLLAVGLSLLAAGCGDDDDDETATTPTTPASDATEVTGVATTKEQWIATADEVCANSDQEVIRAVRDQGLGRDSTPEEIATFSETVILPVQRAQLETLRGLAPPEGEEDAVNEILDAVEAGLDEIEGDPELLADPDRADAALDEASQLARDYGLLECGAEN